MTYLGFVNRYHCPLPGCGWAHDVDLGAEPPPPIVVPVADFDPVAFRVTDSRVLADAISTATERQFRELMERTETVIREHLEGHDFVEVVLALTAAQQAMERVRALHQPVDGHTGWGADDDPTPGSYGDVTPACTACGSQDDAVRWPCPTIAALDGTGEAS